MIHIIFQEELRDYLLSSFPEARTASGGREVVMRCRFCGDSTKHPNDAHLYISLGYDDRPPMYNCFLCNEGGILTPAVLRELGLYDYSIHERLAQLTKDISSRHPKLMKNSDVYFLDNYFVRNDPVSYTKLNYVNERLGLTLTFKEMIDNKIVLNLCDVLETNHLEFTCKPEFGEELDQHFVGFISQDNNFVIMRNVDSSLDVRYHKYNLHGKMNNDKRYYILPCNIDMCDPRPIEVHIAEGPFDILSIKYNVVQTTDRCLFVAIGGKAYKNIARHLIEHMGIINMNLHFYVDNDVDDKVLYSVVSYLAPYDLDIYLHRNRYPNEKDYGVPRSKIKDTITLINKRHI